MSPDAGIPDSSVIITPTEMYREMQDIGRKVDHLTSVLDPWQHEIRNDITDVRAQLAENVAERKAEDEKLRIRIGALESRPVVTPKAMWSGIGVLVGIAAVAVAIIAIVAQGS